MAAARFRIKSPPVVAETLDGEATIVDLESGTYYALNESGTFIWDELARGQSAEAIADGLATRYELEPEDSRRTVDELAVELTKRELIVPLADGDASSAQVAAGNGSGPTVTGNGGYKKPELSTFTDMQELLLLDPVHEVDESGWPNQP